MADAQSSKSGDINDLSQSIHENSEGKISCTLHAGISIDHGGDESIVNGTNILSVGGGNNDVAHVARNNISREIPPPISSKQKKFSENRKQLCSNRPAMNSLMTARALGSVQPNKNDVLDLLCIGFGPASLAIAIALADAYSKSTYPLPKVLFMEKQENFAWHSGMQLPSAKMQISFLKDLATPRDPTSPYTFINYLHAKGRLNQFINLGTFLPSRAEYEDYMRWCAEHFEGVVKYGRRVLVVEPDGECSASQKTRNFRIKWRSITDNESGVVFARHVVVAAGGEPYIPEELKPFTEIPRPRVMHSSQYAIRAKSLERFHRENKFTTLKPNSNDVPEFEAGAETVDLTRSNQTLKMTNGQIPANKEHVARGGGLADLKLQQDVGAPPISEERRKIFPREKDLEAGRKRFVVIGNGQSAAEIFCDLGARFPDAEVCMIIKGAALRPSDDSPFINEIFDPERVDDMYHQHPTERKQAIDLDRGTNYGVVRLELLEHIYEQMYMQRIQIPNPPDWRQKIIPNRRVIRVDMSNDKSCLLLELASTREKRDEKVLEIACSHIFVATGYTREAHQEILKATRELLPKDHQDEGFPVGRNYRVEYDRGRVEDTAGIWLQGCNESTHGLSDTLLSILAVRGGEIVQSIFGDHLAARAPC